MIFKCFEQFNIEDNVELQFYDAFGNKHSKSMYYKEDYRYIESGEDIVRYKFVINGMIRLNDPYALKYVRDDNGEIWSVPNTDMPIQSRNISMNGYISINEQININEYAVSDIITSKAGKSVKKKEFVLDRPLNLYFRMNLSGVRSLHSITVIYFQPDGRIYYLEEGGIYADEEDDCEVDIIFKKQISETEMRFAEGVWQIRAFLDGKSVIKDYFVLKKNIISNMVVSYYSI